MTYTIPAELLQNKPEAEIGMWLEGDEWDTTSPLIAGDELDSRFFGTGLRFARSCDFIPSLPVKIEITGRVVHFNNWGSKIRCAITTWDQNEDPVTFRGWLHLS